MRKTALQEKSRFPKSTFWITLGVLLLTSGIHVGILIGMERAGWAPIVQTHVMVFYWIGAAALLTWIVRLRMKTVYDTPMQEISAATKKVAHGDFTVRISPLHDEDHEDYLDFMIHDLNAMIEELGSIETLKTDFVSNVSHEIKTPISVIQNYARLLESDSLTVEDRREYANTISNAAMRLNTLITNILRLNRLENQKLQPVEEEFDLSAQLTECLLAFEQVWEEKGIEIEPQIEDGITVCSDKELLSVVWNNLLSNAFKFTENGGMVGVNLSQDDEYVSVSVSDTGCGISEDAQRHIFDKFYQGDTSHATQGNGLGLTLVKRIIDIIGGEIFVTSVFGEGTNFTVKLRRSIND